MLAADTTGALVAAAATVTAAVLGLIGVLIMQSRTNKKIEKVYDHVNRSEVQVVDPEDPSHTPRTFREEMRDGFKQTHDTLDKMGGTLENHEERITHIEQEIA